MVSQQTVSLGLTQFIDFTAKGSSARLSMVKKIKYQDEYHPAFDYWKILRESIISFHQENLSTRYLDSIIENVDEKKRKNYALAIRQYKKFLKNKEIQYFNPGKSFWTYDNLAIRSTPELGLTIDGIPHVIKLYFKGKNEKVDKRNAKTAATLLQSSNFENPLVENIKYSILNIDKNNLISNTTISADTILTLESEANQFLYLWNKV